MNRSIKQHNSATKPECEHLYSLDSTFNMSKMETKRFFIVSVLVMFFICMFLLPQISATGNGYISSLSEVKQRSSVMLPQAGTNGTSSWAFCNITNIFGPDNTIRLSNLVMLKNGFSFTYQLVGNYTSDLGTYVVEGICGDGYNIEPFAYTFKVTTTGDASSSSLWISLILIIFSIIFLIISLILDNEYLGFITGVLFLVSGIYVMIYGFGDMADLYTRAIGMVLIGIGLLIFFISAFYAYDDPEATGFKRLLGLEEKSEPHDDTDHFQREDSNQ
jgi:uncharacterized protein YjeT (DUF2065 family)